MSEFKKCPYCAEEIRAEAIKCKHCWSDLADVSVSPIKNEKVEEVVVYEWKAHWCNYIIPIILIFTLYLAPIWIYYIFFHSTKKIILTNKKFTYSFWILNKKQLDLKLEKIESIWINKSLIEIIFWTWTVVVSWTWWNNEPIPVVDKPNELKNQIDKLILW